MTAPADTRPRCASFSPYNGRRCQLLHDHATTHAALDSTGHIFGWGWMHPGDPLTPDLEWVGGAPAIEEPPSPPEPKSGWCRTCSAGHGHYSWCPVAAGGAA